MLWYAAYSYSWARAKGLVRWRVQRRTQLIHYAIIGARQSRAIFISLACTDIGGARTAAGNCRYRNWFNYHSVLRRRMAPTRSAVIELSTTVYPPGRSPLLSQTAVMLLLSSLLVFNYTPLPLIQTPLCVESKTISFWNVIRHYFPLENSQFFARQKLLYTIQSVSSCYSLSHDWPLTLKMIMSLTQVTDFKTC